MNVTLDHILISKEGKEAARKLLSDIHEKLSPNHGRATVHLINTAFLAGMESGLAIAPVLGNGIKIMEGGHEHGKPA